MQPDARAFRGRGGGALVGEVSEKFVELGWGMGEEGDEKIVVG